MRLDPNIKLFYPKANAPSSSFENINDISSLGLASEIEDFKVSAYGGVEHGRCVSFLKGGIFYLPYKLDL